MKPINKLASEHIKIVKNDKNNAQKDHFCVILYDRISACHLKINILTVQVLYATFVSDSAPVQQSEQFFRCQLHCFYVFQLPVFFRESEFVCELQTMSYFGHPDAGRTSFSLSFGMCKGIFLRTNSLRFSARRSPPFPQQ